VSREYGVKMEVKKDTVRKELYVHIGGQRKYVFIAPENASDQELWDVAEALSTLSAKPEREWVVIPHGWEVKVL